MNFLHDWLKTPQRVWLRRAMFQVHLWTGLGVGLYILVISVTGSILVFRPELSRAFSRGQVVVEGSGTPLTDAQVEEAVSHSYPGFKVSEVWRPKNPNAALEVSLDLGDVNRRRLIHPFNGEDLGPTIPFLATVLDWMLDLHDNLMTGETGRLVNGAGGFLLTVLALTGAVIWWPGIRNWARSLILHRGVSWKRFNWDLHSAVGFWTFLLVFMWAFSGFYLVYQEWFNPIVDYFEPPNPDSYEPRMLEDAFAWLPRLHFGRFNRQLGLNMAFVVKVFWLITGLAPAILFVTGGLMWWNRLIRKPALQRVPEPQVVEAVSMETVK
jgi:uncharacterized iron-regulated membrane protein